MLKFKPILWIYLAKLLWDTHISFSSIVFSLKTRLIYRKVANSSRTFSKLFQFTK